MQDILFIGYHTLEEWLRSVGKNRPVFASLITEPGKVERYGTRMDKLVVLAAQPGDDDLVHYCRLMVGQLQYVAGQPFGADHAQRIERAQQALGIVRGWLAEHGLTIRNGVAAMPENLRLLDGWADFLVFDQKTQEYKRYEPTEET